MMSTGQRAWKWMTLNASSSVKTLTTIGNSCLHLLQIGIGSAIEIDPGTYFSYTKQISFCLFPHHKLTLAQVKYNYLASQLSIYRSRKDREVALQIANLHGSRDLILPPLLCTNLGTAYPLAVSVETLASFLGCGFNILLYLRYLHSPIIITSEHMTIFNVFILITPTWPRELLSSQWCSQETDAQETCPRSYKKSIAKQGCEPGTSTS